jgi:hypothetical protein
MNNTAATQYVTAAEAAKQIRQALKERFGLTARDVSVRSSEYSGGSSIRVELKGTDRAANVPVETVTAIAKDAEHIHRCEASGEILSGANRYVSVGSSQERDDLLATPYLAAAEDAVAKAADGPTERIVRVSGDYGVSYMHHNITLWGPRRVVRSYLSTARQVAALIGEQILTDDFKLAEGGS